MSSERAIALFSFQNYSAEYIAKFVFDVKQFKLRACPTCLTLTEMYFLDVIGTVCRLKKGVMTTRQSEGKSYLND